MTTRSQPAAKHLTINGLRLRYLEWGRPDALPVVCVHGYTSSAEAFNALARRIQDRAHIIAMDAATARAPGLRTTPTNTPIRPAIWRRSSISSASAALY